MAKVGEKIATRQAYGSALLALGKADSSVVVLGADLNVSMNQTGFAKAFPERFFNFGISEQDMVSTAAGLAWSGKTVFAGTFAIFMEIAFERARQSIARPSLNVKLVGGHAGLLTGEDGESAHAMLDLALFRGLPNFTVVFPADATETEKAVLALSKLKAPAYLRVCRGKTPVFFGDDHPFQLGKAHVVRDGGDATIVSTGPILSEALQAAAALEKEGVSARVINMHTIKPLDKETLLKAARDTGVIVTIEDHSIIGGLGSAVSEVLSENYPVPLFRVGVRDTFTESGTPEELYRKYGLTADNVVRAVKNLLVGKRN
ncbi:MAG TPA: transketolase C-terminal domain-containing protein [archaeon]|nr:transketolase C-terminal domain-containing protein [archaeon]